MKHYFGDQIEKMRRMGHVAHMGKRRAIHRVLVGKPEGKENTWKTQAYMGRIILRSSESGLGWHGLD
jgi:hypothetical protein